MKDKQQKDSLILKKTFVKGTYVPSKEDLIALIMKDEVSVCIMAQSKYESGKEVCDIKITHI